ncbi:hypothetical protein ACPCG0_10810 [Propionibacteriaceae bacterium Y1923]|uniref:hypothetical protein n=1 Tax=Aestuariimicrobium sp. Y1814 TaxID=3418742 RepID=UPI003C17868C
MKTRLIAVSLLVLALFSTPVAARAAQPAAPTSIAVSGGTVIGGGGGVAQPNNIWCAWLRLCVS